MKTLPINRSISLDVAKGLCMLAVVLAHNAAGSSANPIIHVMARLTVAVFFIFSGVFLSLDQTGIEFIKAKADTLLKPYFAATAALGLGLLGFQFFTAAPVLNPIRHVTRMLYASGHTVAWVPLWFLPALFVALVSSFSLLKLLKKFAIGQKASLSLAFAFLVVGAVVIDVFWNPLARGVLFPYIRGMPGLPWSIDLLPLTTGLVILGYLLRAQILKMQFNPVMSLIVGLSYAATLMLLDLKFDLYNRVLSHAVFSILQIAMTTYLVLQLALFFTNEPRVARTLAYLGRNTIIILGAHYFIQLQIFSALKGKISLPYNCAISYATAIIFSVITIELVNRSVILRAVLLKSTSTEK